MNGNTLNIEQNSNNEEQLKQKIKEFFNTKYPIEKMENKYLEDLKKINKLSSLLKLIEKRFDRIEEISHQTCYKCRLRLLQELDNKNNKSYTPDKIIKCDNHIHNNLSTEKKRCKTPELQINKKKNVKQKNNEKNLFHVNTKNNEYNNQTNLKRSILHNKNNNIKTITHSHNSSNITNHSQNGQNKKNDIHKLNNQKESHFKKVNTTIEKNPNKKLVKPKEEKFYKINTLSTNKNKRTLTPNLEINKKKKLIKNQFDELQDRKKNISYVEIAQKKNNQHKLNKSHDSIIRNGIIGAIDDIKNTVNGIHQSLNLIQSKNKVKEKLNIIRKKRSNSFSDNFFDNNIGKKIDYSIIDINQNNFNNNNKLDNKNNYETEIIESNINPTKNVNFKNQSNINKNIKISPNNSKINYNSERNSVKNNKDNKGYNKLSLKVKRIKENNYINEYRVENEFIKNKNNYKNNNTNNNNNSYNKTKTEINENNDNNINQKDLNKINNEEYKKLISSLNYNNYDDKFNIDIFENKKKELNNNNVLINEKIKEEKLNKQLQEENLQIQKEKEKYFQCLILLLKSGFLIPKKIFYLITNSNLILSQFSITDLIKQTISNLESNYNKLNEYVSKYNINQFEEPFKYNEKSKEKLNLITENNEIDLCSKSQPFIIINLFTIIYIILGENYLEIPTRNLIINLYQTIFKKYKINSISKFYLNLFIFIIEKLFLEIIPQKINLSQIDMNKINQLKNENPKLFNVNEMMKVSQSCSYLILCLIDYFNYINKIYDDGTTYNKIKEADSKLKTYKSKLILLKARCKI